MEALLSFLSILQRQASVLTPSMFMAHDPQMPSRHDRRNVSVGSTSFLILIRASSTGERNERQTAMMSVRGEEERRRRHLGGREARGKVRREEGRRRAD